MESIFGSSGSLREALLSAAVFAASIAVLFALRKVFFSSLYRWARKTDTRADDIILDAIKAPSIYWAVAVSLYITLDASALPAKHIGYGKNILYVLIVVSVTFAVANISSTIVQNAIQKTAASTATGLSRAVIRGFIFAIGLLIVLNGLGISITPILTALGVGGLAVALALQDTLSNLFAGVHMLIERPVRVGDYIRLATGEEGYVVDIGWRTTRIRQLANNIVIIPNNKLSQSTITNYYLPEPRMALLINIPAGFDADPEKVERVLVEEAEKASGSVKGLLADPPPMARLIPGFGESSLNFTLICQVAEYTDQYLIQHELRKRILKRFREEGIEIPCPIRTVRIKKEE